MWHLLRKVKLSMPCLATIDFETFWNIETLKATGLRKNCGRYYSKCDDRVDPEWALLMRRSEALCCERGVYSKTTLIAFNT